MTRQYVICVVRKDHNAMRESGLDCGLEDRLEECSIANSQKGLGLPHSLRPAGGENNGSDHALALF